MKNSILILLLGIVCSAAAQVQSQAFTTIEGRRFRVVLDEQTRTAAIVDFEHEIDDSEFPLTIDSRKLKFRSKDHTLKIPETVMVDGLTYTINAIGRAAFADYRNIDYVEIPETVNMIGDYAFFRSSLREVTVPGSVMSIGKKAFGNCDKLIRIAFPRNVAMGDNIYGGCRDDIIINSYGNYAQTETKKVELPVVVSSDIDENIPVSQHRAENTFAIIIANEEYQNDPDVDYAMRDGETFRKYCLQVLGIPSDNIRFQENATLNNMRTMVNWVSNVAQVYGGEAKILFYYAGHGIPDADGNTCLLPVDGTAKDPATGYSLQSLYASLGGLDTRNVCVFLDACFSGKQRNNDMLVAARGVRRAKEETPQGNLVVFSASKEDETAHSYPEKGHGLFTYFLCKKLQETEGNVTLGELADYVSSNVAKRSVVVLNTMQTPTTSASPVLENSWRDIKLR